MGKFRFCLFGIFLIGRLVCLSAGVVPGRWEKVVALEPGTAVSIRLQSGERIDGVVRAVQASALTLDIRKADPVRIRKQDVSAVTRSVADSRLNGRLIGAGAGFGVGFLSVVAFEKSVTASGFRLQEENLSLAILGGLIGAGLGTLTGHFIDRSQKSEEVLYLASVGSGVP